MLNPNLFNWNMDQHKAYAAELERRAQQAAQAQEILRSRHETRSKTDDEV
jgi:hypothetical protein